VPSPAHGDRSRHGQVSDRRSAAIPALPAAQAVARLLLAGGHRPGGSRMQLTPAYLTSVATFYTSSGPFPRPRHDDIYICHQHLVFAAGRRRPVRRDGEGRGRRRSGIHVSSSSAWGACDIAPWPRSTASTSARLTPDERRADRWPTCAPGDRSMLPRTSRSRYRRSVARTSRRESTSFRGRDHGKKRADTAGLPETEAQTAARGRSAPIEIEPNRNRGRQMKTSCLTESRAGAQHARRLSAAGGPISRSQGP